MTSLTALGLHDRSVLHLAIRSQLAAVAGGRRPFLSEIGERTEPAAILTNRRHVESKRRTASARTAQRTHTRTSRQRRRSEGMRNQALLPHTRMLMMRRIMKQPKRTRNAAVPIATINPGLSGT